MQAINGKPETQLLMGHTAYEKCSEQPTTGAYG